MEDLTKQQIVMVTLLVSFVTSIATGIITVSMMNQAPQTFTQTINRVVERTIEKVVPDASVIKTIETKVIMIDDQVSVTSQIGLESVVRILDEENNLVATGPLISKSGKTIAHILPGKYFLQYGNATKMLAKVDSSNESFSIVSPVTEVKYEPLTLAKEIKAGKAIVLIAGENVFQGIIQNASTTQISIDKSKQTEGSFILDLTGSLVGVNINDTFVPASTIAPFI